MSAEKLDIQVLAATNLDSQLLQGTNQIFYVAHVGAERYRSQTQQVRGNQVYFQETMTFVAPEELEEIVFQLWGDQGYGPYLIAEGDIDPEEEAGLNRQVTLTTGFDEYAATLNLNLHNTSGEYEDFGVQLPQQGTGGTRSIGGEDFSQSYDPDGVGVGQQDQDRGLFGNKKQQYERPPPVSGYQGPNQAAGQPRSTTSNVVLGVGGAAAIIGIGYLVYKRHQRKKKQKQQRKDDRKRRREQKKLLKQQQQQRKRDDKFNNSELAKYYRGQGMMPDQITSTPSQTTTQSNNPSNYNGSQSNMHSIPSYHKLNSSTYSGMPSGYPANPNLSRVSANSGSDYSGPPGMYQTPPEQGFTKNSYEVAHQYQRAQQQSQGNTPQIGNPPPAYQTMNNYQSPSQSNSYGQRSYNQDQQYDQGQQGGFSFSLGEPPVGAGGQRQQQQNNNQYNQQQNNRYHGGALGNLPNLPTT